MSPKETHEIVSAVRSQRDEDMLDLVRSALGQLNLMADRLEVYARDVEKPASIQRKSDKSV